MSTTSYVGHICNCSFCNQQLMAKLQLEHFLPYRLNRIAAAVSQDFRSVYGRHHDLTIPEWRLSATPRPGLPVAGQGSGDDTVRPPSQPQIPYPRLPASKITHFTLRHTTEG